MPKLTIDGKEIEVARRDQPHRGRPAGRRRGPALLLSLRRSASRASAGCAWWTSTRCRGRQIACNTQAAEGMVVHDARPSGCSRRGGRCMEFHLINHPLDCPVCDQAGECWLQIYYMKHGLYDPRMIDEKVHKPKAVPLGPARHPRRRALHPLLALRALLRRDHRHRRAGHLPPRRSLGDRALPGHDALENAYSGNVIDICPVGALTDRDFRFQVRVWYLDTAKSHLHRLRPRLQHRDPHQPAPHPPQPGPARGAPQAALQCRRQPVVDLRRRAATASAGSTTSRLTAARGDGDGQPVETTWDDAVATCAGRLRRYRPRGDRGARLAADVQRGPLAAPAPARRTSGWSTATFAVPPRDAGRGRQAPDPRRQEPEHARRRAGRAAAGRGRARRGGILDARCRGRRSSCSGSSTTTSSRRACRAAEVSAGARPARRRVVFQGPTRTRTQRARAPGAARARPTSSATAPSPTSRARAAVLSRAVAPLGRGAPDWEILALPPASAARADAASPPSARNGLRRAGRRGARLRRDALPHPRRPPAPMVDGVNPAI